MQGVQGPRAVRAARGVSCRRCAAQGGGHVQLRGCVWAWRGCREARNARRARVPVAALRYRLAPRGETRCVCVCVCLCATQPGAGCGGVGAACEEAAGKRRASPVRRYTTGGGPPPAQRRMRARAFAGLRGGAARLMEPQVFAGGGCITSGLGESRRGLCKEPAGACASARPPDPVARGRLPKRRARQDEKKKMPERRLHMGPPEPRGHLGPPKEAVKGAGKGGGLTRGTKRGW